MKTRKGLSVIVVCLVWGMLFGAQSVLAATVQVGGCLPSVKNYPTITAAVGAVPAGSIVKVCPGRYPEQFIISTPLTLEGVTSGDSDRAVVAVPSCCLASNVDSIFGDAVVAQVLVLTGAVNISNLTVDGTGNGQGNLVDVVGIFYASGSSGTVNGVTTLGQSGNSRGYGIWAENGNATAESVTIENCDIHDVDNIGIFVGSSQNSPTLTATVKGNIIVGVPVGVHDQAAGSVTSNAIADSFLGIEAGKGASNSVLSNIISNAERIGIFVDPFGGTVRSNTIFGNSGSFTNSLYGIYLKSSSATVQSNTIKAAEIGIEFNCSTGNTVSGNTIWDVYVGIDQVPSTQTGTNTYRNVDHIKLGC